MNTFSFIIDYTFFIIKNKVDLQLGNRSMQHAVYTQIVTLTNHISTDSSVIIAEELHFFCREFLKSSRIIVCLDNPIFDQNCRVTKYEWNHQVHVNVVSHTMQFSKQCTWNQNTSYNFTTNDFFFALFDARHNNNVVVNCDMCHQNRQCDSKIQVRSTKHRFFLFFFNTQWRCDDWWSMIIQLNW